MTVLFYVGCMRAAWLLLLARNVQSAIIWNLGRGVCAVIPMIEREQEGVQERECGRQVRVRYDTIRNGVYL